MLKIAKQAEEGSLRKKLKKLAERALVSVQIPRMKKNVLNYVYIEAKHNSDSSAEDVDK